MEIIISPTLHTIRHEGQSIQKISRTLKVSSSAIAKTIKRYDETDSTELQMVLEGGPTTFCQTWQSPFLESHSPTT
jgi:transposase